MSGCTRCVWEMIARFEQTYCKEKPNNVQRVDRLRNGRNVSFQCIDGKLTWLLEEYAVDYSPHDSYSGFTAKQVIFDRDDKRMWCQQLERTEECGYSGDSTHTEQPPAGVFKSRGGLMRLFKRS